jgi:hypothetical protein
MCVCVYVYTEKFSRVDEITYSRCSINEQGSVKRGKMHHKKTSKVPNDGSKYKNNFLLTVLN